MLPSQKIPGVRNQDFGRNNNPAEFAFKQYTPEEGYWMEEILLNPDLIKMTGINIGTDIPWAKMAKREGHKARLPNVRATEASAEAGRKFKKGSKTAVERIREVLPSMEEPIYASAVRKAVNCNHSTAKAALDGLCKTGELTKAKVTQKGQGYMMKGEG